MDVSIIIVNYNTRQLLQDCIRSLYEKTKQCTFEVIVVDNHSLELIEENDFQEYPQCQVLWMKDNLGFGKANNEGIKIAKGEFVLFLNSDTLLINDAVSELCDYMRKHKKVGVCGGNLYTKEGLPNMSYTMTFPTVSDYFSLLLGLKRRTVEELFNKDNRAKAIGGYISGADLMMRREFLERYGGFDPDFFMYFEDVELCYRASRYGLEIHSVPSAQIIHLQGGSTLVKGEGMKTRSRAYLLRSEFLYFRKRSNRMALRLLWLGYWMKTWGALFIYSCLRRSQRVNYWKTMWSVLRDVRDEKIV